MSGNLIAFFWATVRMDLVSRVVCWLQSACSTPAGWGIAKFVLGSRNFRSLAPSSPEI